MAVNPRDPSRILVAWIQDGRATDLVMASRNGGRTFSRILVPGLSACTGGPFQVASDPGVDFSADGRQAWFSAIVVDIEDMGTASEAEGEGANSSMYAFRSSDSGFSWSTPSVIQPATNEFWDLPRLTADPRRPKRAYYVYDLREPVGKFGTKGFSLFSKTTNSGQTWSTPTKLYDPQTKSSWPGISKILVNKDNSLLDVMAIVDTDPSDAAAPNTTQQIAVRSTNRGRTWSEPMPIGALVREWRDRPGHQEHPQHLRHLSVADRGPERRCLRQLAAARQDAPVAVSHRGRTVNRFGLDWRTSHIGIDGQGALPTIEVAGDGTVGVVYYVAAPESIGGNWPTKVMVATSRDHGRHWNRRQIAGPFNLLTTGSKARACCFVGDFEGIDRLPHGIAAAYSMGEPQAKHKVDVYFSRITTSGRSSRPP